MAELEAAHKAKQQGVTRWREAGVFANLLELADAVDMFGGGPFQMEITTLE